MFLAAHCRGRASPFVLKQKDQKFKTVRRLLCARGRCAAKPTEPGLERFTPCFAAPGPRFSKNFLCPATARAIIVLPVFTRSCRTDGVGIHKLERHCEERSNLYAVQSYFSCISCHAGSRSVVRRRHHQPSLRTKRGNPLLTEKLCAVGRVSR